MDSLAPNTIIGIVLALFAVLGFLKNFVKFFFNLIALAIGALGGLWGYNNGFSLAKNVVAKPEPWMPIAVGVLIFIIGVCFVRMILNFLSGKSNENSQVRTGGFGMPGGTFGLIFGIGVAYFMLTGVRYAGTVAEMKRLKDHLAGTIQEADKEPVFIQLKKWIDESEIGKWHQKIDFINDPARVNLAKLAVVNDNRDQLGIATQGRPSDEILEALPVDDAEIRASIEEGDFAGVLRNQNLRQRARDHKNDEALLRLNIEKVLGLR
ncbi:CvpA family protein [Verrucomicrobiaceae bacterium 227]